MKKLLVLLLMLLPLMAWQVLAATNSFAFFEQLTNGNCEGEDTSNFYIHENGQPLCSRITNGVGVGGSRGIMVFSDVDYGNNWNTEFFIYTPYHTWVAGEKYKFSMKVRADEEALVYIQAHNSPTNFIYYEMLEGSYTFTTEWQEITFMGEITEQQDGMHSIAILMNIRKEANTYYFDDMSWQAFMDIDEPMHVWQSLIDNGDMEGNDAKNFASRENGGDIAYKIYDGVGTNGSRGVKIASDGGNPDTWESEFWIVSNEIMQEGTRVHVEFDYRADDGCVGTRVVTQSHFRPSEYNFYSCIGILDFDAEWKHYIYDFTVNADLAGAKGMKSIAFNMSPNSEYGVYYIDNIVLMAEKLATVVNIDFGGINYNLVLETKEATVTGYQRLSIANVNIPASVTYKGEEYKVTCIEDYAFCRSSSLSSISIGSDVKYILNLAFASCFSLTDVYCYAKDVPNTSSDAFINSSIENVTLHVPAASIEAYRTAEPWKNFKNIVAIPKCATPIIKFINGELLFSCDTEGVDFVSKVTAKEANKYLSNKVTLGGTYNVTVYATKEGYENSDEATMEINLGNGEKCDVNKDGTVDVADIATVIDRMAQLSRVRD